MTALPPLAPTGIGSVPFTDLESCVALILRNLGEMPFWPQMVRLGYQEDMVPQGAGGLPALKIKNDLRAVTVDPDVSREKALTRFYESVWSGDLSPFALKPEEARGFFYLCQSVERGDTKAKFLKGQVVGPVTFAGMIKDETGKPILYDRELTQASCQGLALKAAWQAKQFRNLGRHPVIFFDEPLLTGFGSAFLTISRDEVVTILTETLETARQFGPLSLGVHCCGNTDWTLFLETPFDILSFDSYGYFDSLLIYGQALRRFLHRGGWLAWGLIPTRDELQTETAESLWQRFQGQVQQLGALGLKPAQVLSQALLTPACGLGYTSPEAATRTLEMLADFSARGREWLNKRL